MATRIAISRIGFFLILAAGVAAVVGSLAFIYLPAATITISPAQSSKTVEQTILLSSTAQEPDFIKFILPAKTVEKTITSTKSFQRQGATVEDFARGTVTLTNNSNDEQRLVAKTHLRHEGSGSMFLIQDRVAIPPQSKIDVAVAAEQKGAGGNVDAGKFIVDRLPESAQALVYGTSVLPMSGGLSVATPLSEEELQQATTSLENEVRQRALGELTAETGGAALRPELVTVTTEDKQISAQAGSTAQSFTITATLKAHGFIADDNDLLGLTLLALRAKADSDQEFVSHDPSSFKITVTRADFARNQANIDCSLRGTFAHSLNSTAFATQNLAGLSKAEVVDHFKQIDGVGDVQVALSPFWVTTIPSRADAVKVEIKNTEAK